LPLDGRDHASPGVVIFDVAVLEVERQRERAWSELRSIVDQRRVVPKGVTLDMIAAARKALAIVSRVTTLRL
jgi:hypothetical protein